MSSWYVPSCTERGPAGGDNPQASVVAGRRLALCPSVDAGVEPRLGADARDPATRAEGKTLVDFELPRRRAGSLLMRSVPSSPTPPRGCHMRRAASHEKKKEKRSPRWCCACSFFRIPPKHSSPIVSIHGTRASACIFPVIDYPQAHRQQGPGTQRTTHPPHRPHPSCACSSACIFHSPLEGLDSQHRHTAGSRACLGDAKEADGGRGVGGGEREGGKELARGK